MWSDVPSAMLVCHELILKQNFFMTRVDEVHIDTSNSEIRLGVIGAGYVGLTTAVCLASLGFRVICSEKRAEIVRQLRAGRSHIHEDGLQEILEVQLANERLTFTGDNQEAISGSLAVMICVPTPDSPNGETDTSAVDEVVRDIAASGWSGTVFLRSTVPVGLSERVSTQLELSGSQFFFVPEFLREGSAVHDFLHPARIVIGGQKNANFDIPRRVFGRIDAPIVEVSLNSAELIKYVSNAFLAMKVSFVNEIATLCDLISVDVSEVMRVVGLDERIGELFLNAGPGWGGSCFPKDIRSLVQQSRKFGLSPHLISAIEPSNQARIEYVSQHVLDRCHELGTPNVAVLGLAFKANTNDVRESPAVAITSALLGNGVCVKAYDPIVQSVDSLCDNEKFTMCSSIGEALLDTSVVVVLTEWNQFRTFDPMTVPAISHDRVVIDTRLVLNEEEWKRAGFRYVGLGAGNVNQLST